MNALQWQNPESKEVTLKIVRQWLNKEHGSGALIEGAMAASLLLLKLQCKDEGLDFAAVGVALFEDVITRVEETGATNPKDFVLTLIEGGKS